MIQSKDGIHISTRNNVEPKNIDNIFQDLEGDGTYSHQYIIKNDYELQSIQKEPDAYYQL